MGTTDGDLVNPYDQLLAAFADLDAQGILARPDFTCCQNCGQTEIGDERTPRPGAAEGEYPFVEEGYTFFHSQDTDGALAGDGHLHLAYGIFPGSSWPHSTDEEWDASALAVGHKVAETLRRHGLEVEWNGDLRKRITVVADFASFRIPWVREGIDYRTDDDGSTTYNPANNDEAAYVLLSTPVTDIEEVLTPLSLPGPSGEESTQTWLEANAAPVALRLRLVEPITDPRLADDARLCGVPGEALEHQTAIEIYATGEEPPAGRVIEQLTLGAIVMGLPGAVAFWLPYQHDVATELDPEDYLLVSTRVVTTPEGRTLLQTMGLRCFADAELVVEMPDVGMQQDEEMWEAALASLAHTIACEGLGLDQPAQTSVGDLSVHPLGEVAGEASYGVDLQVFTQLVDEVAREWPEDDHLPAEPAPQQP